MTDLEAASPIRVESREVMNVYLLWTAGSLCFYTTHDAPTRFGAAHSGQVFPCN